MADKLDASGSPSDQFTTSLKSVTDAFKTAGEQAAAAGQDISQCAIRQAEQNAANLFDTLKVMASAKGPAEVTQLYTQFVSESAKKQADQLREMGELLARSGREAWEPVTSVLASAVPRPK